MQSSTSSYYGKFGYGYNRQRNFPVSYRSAKWGQYAPSLKPCYSSFYLPADKVQHINERKSQVVAKSADESSETLLRAMSIEDREECMFNQQAVTILLVEDDAGHARLIEKNLHRAGVSNKIIHLDDGQKAVDFLFGEESANHVPLLILLDLNMPVLDGYQVLSRIKANEQTKRIPVVMLTTTDNPQEIAKCYELGCNIYVTKPVEYDRFSEAIRNLGLFLSIVKVPDEQ